MILRRCLHPTCFLPAKIKNFSVKGWLLVVSFQCSNDQISFWKSQPDCNRFSVGNLMGAASTLFSTNTSQKIQVFSRWQTFNGFRKQVTMKLKKKKKKLVGIVNWNYVQRLKEILMTMKRRGSCCLNGDAQSGSPGHNLKYKLSC